MSYAKWQYCCNNSSICRVWSLSTIPFRGTAVCGKRLGIAKSDSHWATDLAEFFAFFTVSTSLRCPQRPFTRFPLCSAGTGIDSSRVFLKTDVVEIARMGEAWGNKPPDVFSRLEDSSCLTLMSCLW